MQNVEKLLYSEDCCFLFSLFWQIYSPKYALHHNKWDACISFIVELYPSSKTMVLFPFLLCKNKILLNLQKENIFVKCITLFSWLNIFIRSICEHLETIFETFCNQWAPNQISCSKSIFPIIRSYLLLWKDYCANLIDLYEPQL